jgi:hypothetical protein
VDVEIEKQKLIKFYQVLNILSRHCGVVDVANNF